MLKSSLSNFTLGDADHQQRPSQAFFHCFGKVHCSDYAALRIFMVVRSYIVKDNQCHHVYDCPALVLFVRREHPLLTGMCLF